MDGPLACRNKGPLCAQGVDAKHPENRSKRFHLPVAPACCQQVCERTQLQRAACRGRPGLTEAECGSSAESSVSKVGSRRKLTALSGTGTPDCHPVLEVSVHSCTDSQQMPFSPQGECQSRNQPRATRLEIPLIPDTGLSTPARDVHAPLRMREHLALSTINDSRHNEVSKAFSRASLRHLICDLR